MNSSKIAPTHSQFKGQGIIFYWHSSTTTPILAAVKPRKRTPKRAGKGKSTGPKTDFSAIIPVNGAPVRNKAKRAYTKARQDLELARKEKERYESADLPAFQRWHNRHFGKLLTEIRETQQELEQKRMLFFEVESEAIRQNISYQQAYQRIMERRKNPDPPEPEKTQPGSSPWEEEHPHGDFEPDDGSNADWDDMKDVFDEFFEDVFGFRPEDHARHHSDAPPEKPQPTHRIKTIYRSIVRHLHPDVQSEISPEKLEWWHQAQTAYEERDVEQLEMILTLCEIETPEAMAQTSVSLLQRITHQFRSTLRAIKREIKRLKSSPAWNFSEIANPERLRREIKREHEADLETMRELLRAIDEQIAHWAEPPRTRKSRRPSFRPDHPEFLF